MAIYKEDIVDIELSTGKIFRSFLEHTIGSGDKKANRFGIRAYRNGRPETLGGVCGGYFIRADGTTVPITDSAVSGNLAYVTLPEACYAVEGNFALAIKCQVEGTISTMRIVDGVVSRTTTDAVVDPGAIIPSVEDLIEAIEEAVESIPPDYSDLWTSIAPTFSTSAAYAAGRYVTYDGAVYRFITDHEAGSWDASEVTKINVGDEMSNLKGALLANYCMDKPEALPESLFIYENKILSADGNYLETANGYYTTDFIPVYSNALCISGSFIPSNPSYNTLVLYDGDFNPVYMAHGTDDVYLCRHFDVKYFRASHDSNGAYYVNVWENNDIKKYYTSAEPLMLDAGYYIHSNYILGPQGEPVAGFNTWAITDLIRLDNRDVVFSGNFFPNDYYVTFALYNEEREMIMHAKNNDVVRLTDYPDAVYFRAAHSTDSDAYYVSITNRNNAAGITVHVGDGREYTTLRSGIAAAIAVPNSTVIVHPGVYDLTNEFATEIQAAIGSAGITLANNVYVKFLAGSYVKAIFDTSSEWISTYFEPFRGMNFTLDGLNIEASNCRYCVHDEQGGADVQYHNVYKNCVMKMSDDPESGATFLSPQCIGGGLGKYGYIEIIGGHYYSSGYVVTGERPPISYHNGYSEGCDSKIFIRDVYLADDGFFRFGYYGTSTIKTRVMISGCSMGAEIMKRPENSSALIDNFEIVEWNNIVRN